MDISLYLLAAIVLGAAFAQGFSGFGFGILAMAALSLFTADMERASVFVTLAVIVLTAVLLLRSREHMRVDWPQAVLLFLGILVGGPVGYWFVLRYGTMPVCRIVFGICLLLFALNGFLKPHLKRHIPGMYAPVFGLFSGLLSGAFSSGGPPIVLYLYAREDDPRLAVGTLQAVFLSASLYRLVVVLAGHRGIGVALLLQAAFASPFVVLATMAGYWAARRLPCRRFLQGVYVMISLAGISNLLKGLGDLP